MEQRTRLQLLIGAVLLLVVSIGLYKLYNSNKDVSTLVDTYLLGTESENTPQQDFSANKEIAIFFIVDNTGSMRQYSVPKLDTAVIGKSIDLIQLNGGGYVFCSSFDANIKNNQNLYLKVPGRLATHNPPKRKNGETYFEYDRRMKVFEKENEHWKSDSIAAKALFYQQREAYMVKVAEYLATTYSGATRENKATNVKDLLSSAISCVNDLPGENITKFIIGYSDYEETVNPAGKTGFVIPGDVKVFAVNPVPGTLKKKMSQEIVEVHPDRLFDTIF